MNKLLIGLGLVALVAVGSVGVLKLSGGDDRRVGALAPVEKPMPLSWRGTWVKDARYDVGQVVAYEGSSYVAQSPTAGDLPDATEGPWALMAAKGLQGEAGTFNGTLQSPDGKYTLTVANTGIEAKGPAGTITLGSSGILVRSNASVTLDAATTLDLKASSTAALRGSIVHLACAAGGSPVAKQGSPVAVNTQGGNGQVVQGSPTVLAC